jgi:hypothetical protein
MRCYWGKATALGFLGLVAMGLVVPGCSNRLGPVSATQSAGSIGKPNLDDIVLERSKECLELDGWQLGPGRAVLPSTVILDEDGNKMSVNVNGLPDAARDFGVCMQKIFQDMPIAKQPFQEGVQRLNFHLKHANDSDEALRRFLEVIPGVPIIESELVLEADGYTAVLPVTVKVVNERVRWSNLDEALLMKIGKMALDSVGYDEIMKRAEEQGWVKWVPIKQALSATNKQFVADGPTSVNIGEILKESTKLVLTKTAPVAVAISQMDTPAPGPGDALAVGIFFVSLVAVGGISVYIYVKNQNAEVPTTSGGAPAPQPQQPQPPAPPPPPPPPPRETCEQSQYSDKIRCDDPKISHYKFFSEAEAYFSIKVKGIKKEKSKAKATDGPCEDRGGWHTNVKQGKGYVASIMGCDCCDDSSGKAIQKERARVRYH